MSKQRKLSAVLFTDMVGFSRIMQQDEERAAILRKKHREVHEARVNANDGRIIQYFGDGVLCVFQSAIQAAQAALEIQVDFMQEPVIDVRIGLHSGDIVMDEEGVYGDGVNVAARIESFGLPGSVLMSNRVAEDLSSHPKLKLKKLGKFKLKNIAEPMELFALANPPLKVPEPDQLTKGKGHRDKTTIAVLPFLNLSTDPENEYFSDGITEELLNSLVNIEQLQVTARTSAFAFKNVQEDIREIAKKLNVSYVVEGSVRKAANRVRVTAQLIKAADGFHVWSDSFDRDLQDIFAVQDEIAQKITEMLRIHLSPMIREEKHPGLEAYNLYLQGNYYYHKWNPDDVSKSIDYFKKAIEIEPDYAHAHSALSASYMFLGVLGRLSGKAFEYARHHAETALSLDELLSKSHYVMGMIAFLSDRDFSKSEYHFEKSIRMNPGDAVAHQGYAMFLNATGNSQRALREIALAHLMDPLSVIIVSIYAESYFYAGEYDNALRYYRKALDLEPNFRSAWEGTGWVYARQGKYDQALEAFHTYQKMTGTSNKGFTGLGYVYAKMGNQEKVDEILGHFNARVRNEPEVSIDIDYAVLYVGLEEWDTALRHLRNALQNHVGAAFMATHPMWKDLIGIPEFDELFANYGYIN